MPETPDGRAAGRRLSGVAAPVPVTYLGRMPTPHINARPGDFAEAVLMPGDPQRAEHIATTFLEGARRVTDVRNVWGYTGTWQGHRVSVQGSGMGQPSLAIYVNELLGETDCLLKLYLPNLEALSAFMHNFLLKIPEIDVTHSAVALREIKNETALPL